MGIQSLHFMANRWGNNGKGHRLYFLGLQNHFRWWLQACNWKTLAPWKKSCDQLSILKSRDITLLTKVHLVKVSSHVRMWELDCKESWALKNWCFWTVRWRRFLDSCRVPWTPRRSNQSILKEISLECSLEGLMLKLKLQYFDYLMGKSDSLKRPWCRERLKAEGEWDDRGWDGWMASPMQWKWVWVGSESWWWTGKPGAL